MKELLAKVLYEPIRFFNFLNIKKRYKTQKKLLNLKNKDLGRVLVIAPHSDDEVIGCGGLLMNVHYDLLYITDSGASKDKNPNIIKTRKEESLELFKKTKGVNIYFLSGENGDLEKDKKELILKLRNISADYDSVFLVSFWDNHIEHYLSAKFFSEVDFSGDIYLYEVSNNLPLEETTHFYPMDKKEFQNKKDLLNIFKSQISMDFDLFLMLNREKGRRQDLYAAEYFKKLKMDELRRLLDQYPYKKVRKFLNYRLGNHRSFYKTLKNEVKDVF